MATIMPVINMGSIWFFFDANKIGGKEAMGGVKKKKRDKKEQKEKEKIEKKVAAIQSSHFHSNKLCISFLFTAAIGFYKVYVGSWI